MTLLSYTNIIKNEEEAEASSVAHCKVTHFFAVCQLFPLLISIY